MVQLAEWKSGFLENGFGMDENWGEWVVESVVRSHLVAESLSF